MGILSIYLKNGLVFSYKIESSLKAREHMSKIWEGGYRSASEGKLTWWGPHYIDKQVYQGEDISTNYEDNCKGT